MLISKSRVILILSIALALAVGVIIYLVTGNTPEVNTEVVKAQERIRLLELSLDAEKKFSRQKGLQVEKLRAEVLSRRDYVPTIEMKYDETRSHISALPSDSAVLYLSSWLSERDRNR